RVLLVAMLAREGCEVLAFETAGAALEELRKRPAHVIIADRALPQVDGLDLHLRARALHPQLQSILLAASPGLEAAGAAAEGIREYVIKPFQVADVLAVCRAAVSMARAAM